MYTTTTKLRVRYSETDRMGYTYYGNYAQYFEVARVEALREVGLSYRALEDSGVMMPVSEFYIDYKLPAFYDEELTIKTTVAEVPKARIRFEYETFNPEGKLINTAYTVLFFVAADTMRPMRAPQDLVKALEKRILEA